MLNCLTFCVWSPFVLALPLLYPLLLVRNKSHFGFGIAIRSIFAHKLGRFTFFYRIYFAFNIQSSMFNLNSERHFFPYFILFSLAFVDFAIMIFVFCYDSILPQENRFNVRSINNYFHSTAVRGGLFEWEKTHVKQTKMEEQIVERTSHP